MQVQVLRGVAFLLLHLDLIRVRIETIPVRHPHEENLESQRIETSV